MVLRWEGVGRPAGGAILWGVWGGGAPGKGVVGFTPGLEVIVAAWEVDELRLSEGTGSNGYTHTVSTG